jgi:alpha-tubulin suppressor-like RCC1 family protein
MKPCDCNELRQQDDEETPTSSSLPQRPGSLEKIGISEEFWIQVVKQAENHFILKFNVVSIYPLTVFPIFFILIIFSLLTACDLSRSTQEAAPYRPLIASGGAHSCRNEPDGAVVCWGDNRYGQLGNGTTLGSAAPVEVAGLRDAVALAAGDWHTCAVLRGGAVRCWGANRYGQLGNVTLKLSPVPVPVPIGPAREIAAGRTHTCAILTDGTVSCWGDTRDSQTGVQRESRAKPSPPVIVPGMVNAVSVAGGSEHSCAALSDGRLFCWGDNHFGQLGTGIVEHHFLLPSPVQLLGEALAVTAGRRHTCVLLRDRTVECWGKNYEGQLGDGTRVDARTPVRVILLDPGKSVKPLANVAAISAGSQHTCALLESREVYCWGSNFVGQLGRVEGGIAPRPVFSGMTDVVALSAGGWHTCGILSSGETRCFGEVVPYGPKE